MTFREELEKMLRDLHGYEVPLTGEVTLDADLDYENKLVTREIETAITSIINLVDKEVIKDDEDLDVQSEFDKLDIPHPETDKYPYLYSVRQASRNILKAKQRAIIRGNDE